MRVRRLTLAVLLTAVFGVTSGAGAQVYFTEDFESLSLGPPVDEVIPEDELREEVWSPDGPEGWSVDRSNVPAGGVTEWRGWNFVDPIWWNEVAQQDRANFALDTNEFVIAVADGDEWDDKARDEGLMNSTLTSPQIPVTGGSTVDFAFDNSWRPEAPQTARMTAVFDGGAPVELFYWESNESLEDGTANPNFRPASEALNERVEFPIDIPAGASNVEFNFTYEGGNNWWWAIDNIEFGDYEEGFEETTLGPNVDEGRASGLPFEPDAVWTPDAPAGWETLNDDVWGIDEEGIGVTEWKGWTFANKDFWTTVAGDQQRSFFEKGEGTVAIADPDEWDDIGSPGDSGFFEAFLVTPEIDIADAEAGSLTLKFDSSWRPEDTQAANLTVRFDNGDEIEILDWGSDGGAGNFKPDSENETVEIALNNPAGASTMVLTWGMLEATNDWWWAIDNISVSAGGGGVAGDLNGDQLLDVADIGILVQAIKDADLAGDLNGDGSATVADLNFWVEDLKNTYIGDSNLDGEFNSGDLVQVFGDGLYESGEMATWAQGDWDGSMQFDSGDLVAAFTAGGYEAGPRAAVAGVPEPSSIVLLAIGLLGFVRRR